MEKTLETGKQKTTYDPILCALSHVLLFGGVYLYLRLYKRFFLAYLLFFAMAIFFSSNIPMMAVFVGVMIDTYQQVNGINEGTIEQEPHSRSKQIGGILLIVFALLLGWVILPMIGV